MMRQPKDNHREIYWLVEARILQSPLAQYTRTERLRRGAGGEDQSDWSGYLSVEFRRADTNCSLAILLDGVDCRSPVLDEEGNQLVQYKLTCGVNFPSHGNSDPATVMARLKLYQDVAMLAAELQAEFGLREIWKMTRSAAEVAEA